MEGQSMGSVGNQLGARTQHSLLSREEVEGTYRSTLIAQRLKMEAVHSITSMVIRASHSTMLRDHTPPWNCRDARDQQTPCPTV